MRIVFTLTLICSGAMAQSQQDYDTICRTEVARRLNVPFDRVGTQASKMAAGQTRVEWTTNDRRYGYCMIDNRMRVTEFQDLSRGDAGNRNWNTGTVTNFARVSADTGGHGNFDGENGSVKITRAWVDTRGEPTIALGGDNNFKITFHGEIVRANGDREYTMRILNSDRGSANGTATFRLNSDKNEVEYVSANGRLNGRGFSGNFNRK